jgi:5-methylcytosine-specific restriction endonuclease McrA
MRGATCSASHTLHGGAVHIYILHRHKLDTRMPTFQTLSSPKTANKSHRMAWIDSADTHTICAQVSSMFDALHSELRTSQAENRALQEAWSINRPSTAAPVANAGLMGNTEILGMLMSQQAALNHLILKDMVGAHQPCPIQPDPELAQAPTVASSLNARQQAAARDLNKLFVYTPNARMSSEDISHIVAAYIHKHTDCALASYQTDRARSKIMRSLQFKRVERVGNRRARGWNHIALRPPQDSAPISTSGDQLVSNTHHTPSVHKRHVIPLKVRSDVWSTHAADPNARQSPCYVCGVDIDCMHFTCGHVVASARGGDDTVANLRPICSPCNLSMGQRDLHEYKHAYYASKPSPHTTNPEDNSGTDPTSAAPIWKPTA